MAQCLLCDKKGFFLSVGANGLCSSCEPVVVMDVQQRGRIVGDCIKIISKSKKMDVRLSRCDLLIEHAKILLKYEQRGIPTITPLPSQLLLEYDGMHDKIVLESVVADVEKALTKVRIAATPSTRVSETTKALFKIQEGKKELRNSAALDALESHVRRVSHEAQLDAYLEAARKAKFKGNKKKALDQYQEALYFLRTDGVDDTLQAERTGEIQSKISELSK